MHRLIGMLLAFALTVPPAQAQLVNAKAVVVSPVPWTLAFSR